jgi:hypothetical protein
MEVAAMTTMRWQQRLILASVALIAFSSVPLPNVTVRNFGTPPDLEQYCRVQAEMVRIALSRSTDPVVLERRLWGPMEQRCGAHRSYFGD